MSGFTHYPLEIEGQSFVSASSHNPTPPSHHDLPPHDNNNAYFHTNEPPPLSNFPKVPNTTPEQESYHPSHIPNNPRQPSVYYSSVDHPPAIEPRQIPSAANLKTRTYLNVVTSPPPRNPRQQNVSPPTREPAKLDKCLPILREPVCTKPPTADPDKVTNPSCIGCICFPYDMLRAITNNFDNTKYSEGGYRLGEGGFGPVFLGYLCSTAIAIKVLQNASTGRKVYKGDEQFITEISVLTRYRHANLLTLMGYSDDGPSRCIVYEFMSNGTLEDWLEGKKLPLHWTSRHSILMDTARGLLYLHKADPSHPLIHRDVKTANVLLDSSMQAKVGDFGLARQTDINIENKTGTILGTSGYIPPEYYSGEISTKTDVYAFGVVVLEVLTGLPSFDGRCDSKELVSRMRQTIHTNHREMLRWVDKNSGDWPSAAYFDMSTIAWDSLEKSPSFRPDMDKTLASIHKINTEHHIDNIRTPLYSH